MPIDSSASEPDGFWRQTVLAHDGAVHAAEARRALTLEVEGLRVRCAELTAALTQARAAIMVRHGMLSDQAAAINERDDALNNQATAIAERDDELIQLHQRIDELDTQLAAVLNSWRWRAGERLSWVSPRRIFAALRRTASRLDRST
ncbi:MAG: hypothetical protein EOO27_02165 [Comamonadaceae bacterium]|nr:MAG: hypothetical protein EOO27_02165 [Comamonadaceae bacterium]